MNNTISFTSSYRFPMTQPGLNRFKREALVPELLKYSGKIDIFQIPKTGKGNGRISVKANLDSLVEGILKKFGFKRYQKMPLHDAPIEKVDEYVRTMNRTGAYIQKGMQKPRKKKIN